jgi:isoquinoline 1-oxidoreductase alpha subunit
MTTFTLNGSLTSLDVDPDMPLLWALRDTLEMTGTKFGCGMALCGACTVLLDGAPARSCQTKVKDVARRKVTTIEGLSGKVAEAVQQAWIRLDVPQCGYCQSGQVLAATALLTEKHHPSDDDINAALAGNLCRCATYHRIRSAVHEAAHALES